MARKRRHISQGEAEVKALQNTRWRLYKEQRAIDAVHRTPAENERAQELCRQLVNGELDINRYLSFEELWGAK